MITDPQVVRFYTDEHVGRAVAAGLRRRGVDVLTAAEAGMLGATDEAHLALANSEMRVVFTQDADFIVLASQGLAHPGIAFAPQGTPIGDIIRGLSLIYHVLSAEDMIGKIEFI